MPKDPADYRKYRSYYINRETSEAGKNKRVERAQARAKAVKAGLLASKHDPREVDHKRPMDKGGGNGRGNLQVLSRTANRKKFDH